MKRCIKCKEDKPESAFRQKLWVENVCKKCKSKSEMKRRERLKEDPIQQLLKNSYIWP